jgi:hypothetical protein
MELFIPGLILLVFCALVTFVIIPRVNPMILAIISLFALVAAGVHHYSLFAAEYRLSTWQYALAAYTPFIVLGFGILFIIASLYYFFATPFTSIAKNINSSAISAINTVTNAATNATGAATGAIGAATGAIGAVTGAIGDVTGAVNAIKNPFTQAVQNMPPASTATNPLTAAINRGINATFNQGQQKSPVIPGLGFRASEI